MPLKDFRQARLNNKTVLLRVDYNVPLLGTKILDDNRIRESIPTIQALLKKNCRIVIISHLGRPEGQIIKSMSLRPIAKALQKLLKKRVHFIGSTISPAVQTYCRKSPPGSIILLENLRFYKEEEKNDLSFAEKLSRLAEVYVDDAFGCAHRAHASIHAITRYLPSYAGLLLQKEVASLEPLLHDMQFPVTMIIGGAKIDTKIDLIKSFAGRVDHFIMGGGIANTFLAAKGCQLGTSLVEKDKLEVARDIETTIRRHRKNLHLPDDYLIASKISNFVLVTRASGKKIPANRKILDIGPSSTKKFASIITRSKTIIWNGPMGVTEYRPFRQGTKQIALAIAKATANGALSVLGGGDTVDALKTLHLSKNLFSHVSTGGGAMLEYLQNGTLPGLEVLQK